MLTYVWAYAGAAATASPAATASTDAAGLRLLPHLPAKFKRNVC